MILPAILRSYAWSVMTSLSRRVGATPVPQERPEDEWAIAIYQGPSPLQLSPGTDTDEPVLTRHDVSDVWAKYVADPFMVHTEEAWFMFFEIMNGKRGKGEIGLAVGRDTRHWRYCGVVLREDFHLSYPYVFEWMNEHYMIPETFETDSIRLYKAIVFPRQWQFVKTLVERTDFVDPSIVQFGGRWWLFASHGAAPLRADMLRLFSADDLLGEWIEHPRSPIVNGDPCIARPGGRVVLHGGTLIRYAQSALPYYGTDVRAFEICELTREVYREREVSASPILKGTGRGWNAMGMHHIDPHRLPDGSWMACVDGWRWRPS